MAEYENVSVVTRKGIKHFPPTEEGVKEAQEFARKNRSIVQSTRIYKKWPTTPFSGR